MNFKQYLKRGIIYILHGQPVRKVYAKIAYLSPSDMLKGRTALITGGTSGIGYEIAKAFVNAGAVCVITGRKRERVQEACAEINNEVKNKGAIFGLVWDITDVKDNNGRLQETLHLLGDREIDILVNNAGVVGGEIRECTEEKYDTILDTNQKGAFFMSQLIASYMKEKQIKGNILNVGSSSSLRPATSAYTVSKWGIRGLTKGLAKILSPYGITVNGIAPGPTATPMLMPDGIKEDIAFPTNPLGRFILPSEIANMAVFLVSDMGRAIIGDMIFMTGGSGVVTFDDVKYDF